MQALQYQSFQSMISEFNLAYRNFTLNDEQKKYWYQYFKNVEEKKFIGACRKYIANEKYEPKIASLMDTIKNFEKEKEENTKRQEYKKILEKKIKMRRKELGI